MDSREALVALNMVAHVGSVRARQLLEHFGGDASKILSASKHQLLHVRGIGEETAESIVGWEKSRGPDGGDETHRGFQLRNRDPIGCALPGIVARNL